MIKGKLKITHIVLGVLVVAATAAFIVSGVWASQQEAAELPQIGLNRVVKDLRLYHKKFGRFPATFQDIQVRVRKRPSSDRLGDAGRSFTKDNYYYLLSAVDPHAATLWAIPIGDKYKEGTSYFIVVRPTTVEQWKGAALDIDEIALLRGNPTPAQLAHTGLTKQPTPALKKRGGLFSF
ncbi:MAG: hypothetical protein H0W76_13355 [Pyrinomonadaceae bacterium]|nr:hypothetical protein [Pyrinomonadaceae bacterium]